VAQATEPSVAPAFITPEPREPRQARPAAVSRLSARRIQRQPARRDSLRAIAESLNDDGVPTGQGGKQRYAATVRHVLLRTSESRGLGRLGRPSPTSPQSVWGLFGSIKLNELAARCRDGRLYTPSRCQRLRG
jgi:hypothetical protein